MTPQLVEDLRRGEGLLGLRIQKGISVVPAGDVVSLEVTNGGFHHTLRTAARYGMGTEYGVSLTSSRPLSVVTNPGKELLPADTGEAGWEEIELTIAHESNMTANGLALMAVSGIVAACGIATGSIHLVVGAMVIAPGFEPLSRIALGLAASGAGWRRGLADSLKGYLTLALAAAATAWLLAIFGDAAPPGGGFSYLPGSELVAYWTTFTPASILSTAAASVGGAVLLAANRSVLTAGVMIALALIPSAVIASMAVVAGEWQQAWLAAARWSVDVVSVLVGSALVFLWKRRTVHGRRSWL